ncbi:MAG: GGDEF domain-containing protein, partial [Alphaproteobacteria bacterium]|nr:GGDEF domain-containing protein [Alphaproteobacteria bacterium]
KGAIRVLPALVFAAISIIVAYAGYFLIQSATERLLEDEAKLDTELWTSFVKRNIRDLPAIARGNPATVETLAYLGYAREAGLVYSFRVYDANSVLRLRSDARGRSPDHAQEERIGGIFAESVRNRTLKTVIRQGSGQGEPAYYASTLLPITDGRDIAGWVIADIEQTDRRALFFAMAAKVSLSVGSLLAIAPLLGFWRRSRQRKKAERQLHVISHRDQLTDLPNRGHFLKLVDRHLHDPAARDKSAALILLEVSGIANLSQTAGQQTADDVIVRLAHRLVDMTIEGSEVAALDHARFGFFLRDTEDALSVMALAKRLTVELTQDAAIDGQAMPIHIHAGIAMSGSGGNDSLALLRNAELALQAAQQQGGPGYSFFNPDVAKDAKRRIAIQRAIADALANRTFRLDFQPVYNIRTGELGGFEALIRLHDAELGSVSPVEFIPIAEQSGLIGKIGAWCLDEACRVASQWPPHLQVSVNLSPSQFYTGSLITDVRLALDINQFPAYRLEVEITEGTLLKDSDLVLQQLSILREMGVAVALDDFGTGYSSLSYLWKFPFSKIKIDRSFVQALDETQSARGILRSIIKLGHGLGHTVTAEGIENAHQLDVLRELGCDLAQGYLLDRPARVADLAAIILRNFARGLPRSTDEAAEGSARPALPQAGTAIA